MGKWVREKFHAISFKPILHFICVEVAMQLLWWLVTKMVSVIPDIIKGVGFLIIFIVVIVAVAWYLPKLSPRLSGASSEKKIEIDEKTKLWLYQFLKTDKDELGKRIHQFRERWLFDNISATEPFIEVIIQIVNAAVFPIVIKGVEGSFQIQGTKCNWEATMSDSRIPHGEAGNIRISQRLLKDTVEKMVILHNERGGFMVDLNACHLVIQAEEPDVENKPVRVPLRIREKVKINT